MVARQEKQRKILQLSTISYGTNERVLCCFLDWSRETLAVSEDIRFFCRLWIWLLSVQLLSPLHKLDTQMLTKKKKKKRF